MVTYNVPARAQPLHPAHLVSPQHTQLLRHTLKLRHAMHGHRQNGPKHTPWPLYGTRSKARNTARRGLAHRLETRSDTAQVHHLHTRHSTYTWGCGGKENPHISLDLLLPFQLKTLLPGVLTDTAHGNGCCGLTATIHCTRG